MVKAAWRGVLLQQAVTDILEFPLWWYTRGLVIFGRTFLYPVRFYGQFFALRVLAAHLFQPLYGDYTRSGRILSVIVRIGHFLVLSSIFVVVGLVLAIAYGIWMLLPVITVAEFFRTFVALVIPG